MVIRKLISLKNLPVALQIIPTLREASGLAMSSRNLRLSEKDKAAATVISRSLKWIKNNLKPGDLQPLIAKAEKEILAAGFEKIDYVSIADASNLSAVNNWNGQSKLVALAAASIGGVRLIDNLPLN